jgi:hypothetical protein
MVSKTRTYASPRLARFRAPFAALAAVTLTGWLGLLMSCGGAGPYGYARTYEPMLSEKGHLERSEERAYEEVKRAPYDFKATEIAWFGVVTEVSELPDGFTELTLSFRPHQARHLCRDEYADSCRVTVSDASQGNFVARVQLKDEEKTGKERVWVGSLLKVYGMPTGDYDEQGDPVLDAKFYRHWPRGYYVTTAQRSAMKR